MIWKFSISVIDNSDLMVDVIHNEIKQDKWICYSTNAF